MHQDLSLAPPPAVQDNGELSYQIWGTCRCLQTRSPPTQGPERKFAGGISRTALRCGSKRKAARGAEDTQLARCSELWFPLVPLPCSVAIDNVALVQFLP